MARIVVKNNNYFQHNFFTGQFVDEPVSLAKACKRFDLVSSASGNRDLFIIFLISFSPLQIPDAPVNVGNLPENLQAFPLYFSRLLNANDNNFSPHIIFKCPFTDFYVNAWGIDPSDGTFLDCSVDLIASDGDIVEYETQPVIRVEVG